MKEISIGIVILNYNTGAMTEMLVRQLLGQEEVDLSIVVVDNHSTDGSYRFLRETFQDRGNLEFIQTERNIGYAAGNNAGLKYLADKSPDFVAILNPDISISENRLFSRLAGYYARNNVSGLIAPMMKVNGKARPGMSYWRFPSLFDEVVTFSIVLSFLKNRFQNQMINEDLTAAECLAGSFLFTKTDVIRNAGFFDEGTFLYNEETILCHKLYSAGCRNYLVPGLTYEHYRSASIKRSHNVFRRYHILYQSKLYYWRTYRKAGLLAGIVLSSAFFLFLPEKILYQVYILASRGTRQAGAARL